MITLMTDSCLCVLLQEVNALYVKARFVDDVNPDLSTKTVISNLDLKFQPCLGYNAKFNMCCFKHLLLHSVYMKQFAESDKILAWAVSQTKTQVTLWVLQLKFLCMFETTTKSLDLPDTDSPVILYKTNLTVKLGFSGMAKSAVFI